MIEISNKEEEKFQILSVSGEVDASSSIHLDSALAEAIEKKKDIIVDLEHLNYISSAGLGVFMSYLKELETHNLKLILSGLNQKVFNVFEILGLDQLLTIKEDLEQARDVLNEV